MPYFRTLRISNPRFETHDLRFITVKSPALEARGDMVVFAPPEAKADAALVILLHGVYGSCWSWALGGGVHHTARRLIDAGAVRPMIIAMPSDGLWGDGSGYLAHAGSNFEEWIVEDVPMALHEGLETNLDAPRYIAGLSMGGFGALRIGAKYADLFQGISAHSAITHFDQMADFVEEDLKTYAAPTQDRSVLETMFSNSTILPPLRFDCGADDPLLEANRTLHKRLNEAGIKHLYEEFPGGHEWPYWEQHIEKTLRFFDRIDA